MYVHVNTVQHHGMSTNYMYMYIHVYTHTHTHSLYFHILSTTTEKYPPRQKKNSLVYTQTALSAGIKRIHVPEAVACYTVFSKTLRLLVKIHNYTYVYNF